MKNGTSLLQFGSIYGGYDVRTLRLVWSISMNQTSPKLPKIICNKQTIIFKAFKANYIAMAAAHRCGDALLCSRSLGPSPLWCLNPSHCKRWWRSCLTLRDPPQPSATRVAAPKTGRRMPPAAASGRGFSHCPATPSVVASHSAEMVWPQNPGTNVAGCIWSLRWKAYGAIKPCWVCHRNIWRRSHEKLV